MEKSGIRGTERPRQLFYLVLPWLAFTSACSKGEEATASQAPPVDGIVYQSPLDAYLVNHVGRSQSELQVLIETDRSVLVTTCMKNAGYTVRPDEVFSAKEAQDAEAAFLTDFSSHWAADAIKQLNDPASQPGMPGPGEDADTRSRMFNECHENAEVPSARSYEKFSRWLDQLIIEKTQQAQSDERLLTAREQGAKCIGELGYDVDNFSALSSQFHDRVVEIVAQVDSGELTTEDGITQLTVISGEEAAVAEPVNQCAYREIQVQYDILTEFELQIIEEHGMELDEWSQSIQDDLGSS